MIQIIYLLREMGINRKNNDKIIYLQDDDRRRTLGFSSKGVFYSAIAMMLILPIIMYVILYMDVSETQLKEISTQIKGDKMAAYASSVEQDLTRILEISSKRSIGAAVSYIDMNGIALDSADERLAEMIKNGTIYGNPFSLLGTGSLNEWINAIELKGDKYGFDTTVSVLDLRVRPYNSFNILLSATISVNITDNAGTMKVYRVYDEDILIPVDGFEDPLYGLETSGLIKRKITFANITINNTASLDAAVGSGFYMSSAEGASFLDRLEGSLTASGKYKAMAPNQIGMETIVYLPDLSSEGLQIKADQSDVDYLYFDSAAHRGYPVNSSSYSWLKIDEDHADIYGVVLIK